MVHEFDLTINSEFTTPTDSPFPQRLFSRGEIVTDPDLVRYILGSDLHVYATKTMAGATVMPTDEEIARREEEGGQQQVRNAPSVQSTPGREPTSGAEVRAAEKAVSDPSFVETPRARALFVPEGEFETVEEPAPAEQPAPGRTLEVKDGQKAAKK